MENIVAHVVENKDMYLTILTSVISIAAAIATVTPNQTDNKILAVVVKLINIFGLNVGKAKNAEAVEAAKEADKK